MKKTNNAILELLIVFITATALTGTAGCATGEAKIDEMKADTKIVESERIISALEVKTEAFVSTLEVTGTALPVRESFLSTEVPGTVKEILVSEGDEVKKGQILLKLDQSGFAMGVAQAEAGLAAAKANADLMKLEFDRMSKLIASDATAQSNYDRVKAQYDAAQAQCKVVETQLQQAKKAMNDSILRAPYNGAVVMILKDLGEYAPSMPPTMLMKIVNTDSLEVQTFLPEDLSNKIKVGDKARVSIASANLETEGEIIFTSNRLEQATQNFEVRIKIDNADGKIKGGAFTRINFTREDLTDALLVPLRSVLRGSDGKPYVFTVKDGVVHRTDIKIGQADGSRIHVLEGIGVGDQVVTAGANDLKDGNKVKVENNI